MSNAAAMYERVLRRTSAPIRDEGRAPSPSPRGTANPNAHRRHSRRSNTRQVKRTHASQRPRTQLKPQRHSQPHRAPAAKAAAAAPGRINAPTRDEGHAPGPNSGGAADPNAHRRHSRRSSTRQVKRSHARLRAMMSASGRTNPTQRESQGPNNPHPAAASRASGSNCGRRCTITYPA